jgi:alditol oxidase
VRCAEGHREGRRLRLPGLVLRLDRVQAAGANWAGNHAYAANGVHRPGSVAQLQQIVGSATRLKAVGTRHCFNDIADCPGGEQVSLDRIDVPVQIDADRHTVTVGAATRYGDLAVRLDAAGYALPNLASLPHCSVAGSVATATHGSGERLGSLSTSVSAVEMVTADGQVRWFSRDRDPADFPGVVVALGGLGVVTRLRLDLVPAFAVRQVVFERLPWPAVAEHFDEMQSLAYSVSLFTDWFGAAVDQVWLVSRLEEDAGRVPGTLFGARPAPAQVHPIRGMPPQNCTVQLGLPGRWYERLPHFRLDFTPSVGAELQTEYLLPRPHAQAAFEVFRSLSARITPLLLVSEIRTVAADDAWLSPCHGRDSVAVHLTWRQRPAEVAAVLPVLAERLAPLGARPHWGKLFAGPAAGYPRRPDFLALAARLDPAGVFRSPFIARL